MCRCQLDGHDVMTSVCSSARRSILERCYLIVVYLYTTLNDFYLFLFHILRTWPYESVYCVRLRQKGLRVSGAHALVATHSTVSAAATAVMQYCIILLSLCSFNGHHDHSIRSCYTIFSFPEYFPNNQLKINNKINLTT